MSNTITITNTIPPIQTLNQPPLLSSVSAGETSPSRSTTLLTTHHHHHQSSPDSTTLSTKKYTLTPTHLFIGVWLTAVIITGSILTLVLFGWIRLDRPQERTWFEVCSQILNALFTLSAILTHPFRILDTLNIIKLKYTDTLKKDKLSHPAYITQTTAPPPPSPHASSSSFTWLVKRYPFIKNYPVDTLEDKKVMINRLLGLNLLYQMNCIFQYPIAITMWAFNQDNRPDPLIYTFLPLSFLSGAFGGILNWRMMRESTLGELENKRKNEASIP